MKTFVISLIAVSLFAVYATAQSKKEEYKVYSAVLAAMFAGDKVTFDTQVRIGQLVILDKTTTDYAWDPQRENWARVKIRIPDLSDEIIQDYENNRRNSVQLSRSFDIQLKYQLISQREFESLFHQVPNWNHDSDTWTKFYDRFPDSGGYVILSNIGFNLARDRALIYFVHWCNTVCGTGHYLLLDKIDGVWKVSRIGGRWIS